MATRKYGFGIGHEEVLALYQCAIRMDIDTEEIYKLPNKRLRDGRVRDHYYMRLKLNDGTHIWVTPIGRVISLPQNDEVRLVKVRQPDEISARFLRPLISTRQESKCQG